MGQPLVTCMRGNLRVLLKVNATEILTQTGESCLKGYCTVFQHALKSLELTGIVSS